MQAVTAAATLSMADGSTMNVMFPITHYIWGLDRVLAKIDKTTNKSYYYLYNGHGDVVQIVDTSGAIKNTYDYDVWGNFLKKEETIENHFTYFGQTYDETTGLYYLRARYYDPTTGRFTQQDSTEDGYNWYIYGNQNPLMYIDESGNLSATAIAALTAAGACVLDGVVTGVTYKFTGRSFRAGFVNGFISCLGTEAGAFVGAKAGPGGLYAGTIIGSSIGSALGTLVEDSIFSDKSGEEKIKSAAKAAATGIISGTSSAYWSYALELAKAAGSAANTLMEYDEAFGRGIKLFFDELVNILNSQ